MLTISLVCIISATALTLAHFVKYFIQRAKKFILLGTVVSTALAGMSIVLMLKKREN